MPFVPGQKDPLFEAVKSVVTGDTQEGQYARNVLGYEPMQESVRVMEISPERREMAAESLMGRTGEMGAPGFRYGQRVYYDGQPYRIESFHEADRFYPDLRLTLVDDEFTRRISGVDAIEVTVPTETTAMGEDTELLDEAPLVWKRNPGKVDLKQVVSYLRGLAGQIDLMRSMPASVANSLERAEKMDHYKKWSAMSEAEKKNIIKIIIEFGEAAELASSLGRKMWNYIERK